MFPMPVPSVVDEPARVGPGGLLAALGEDLEPGRAGEVYAACGLPVLPVFEPAPGGGCTCRAGAGCRRAGKHPRLKARRPGLGGVHEATSDLATVRGWWRRWPAANVAIRTGPGSFDVADVDGPQGVEALRAILSRAGGALGSAPLRALLAPPARPGTPPPTAGPRVVGGGYGGAALASECARLAAVAPGGPGLPGRNRALYMAALRLGRLAAAGWLDPGEVTTALADVARQVGLSEREIGPTIASGLRNGTAHPRTDLPRPPRQEATR